MTDVGAGRKNVQDTEEIFCVVRHCLVRLRRVPNGCRQPVVKLDRSLLYMLGTIGIDAASSAQSKRGGGGGTGGGGCNTAVAQGSGVLVVLKNVVGRETAHSWQCWG